VAGGGEGGSMGAGGWGGGAGVFVPRGERVFAAVSLRPQPPPSRLLSLAAAPEIRRLSRGRGGVAMLTDGSKEGEGEQDSDGAARDRQL